MNYYNYLFFFASFFLQIFNVSAFTVRIKCDVLDIANTGDRTTFCELNIDSKNFEDGIDIVDLKLKIKKKENYPTGFNPDVQQQSIINNIDKYIMLNARYQGSSPEYRIEFRENNVVIPKNIVQALEKRGNMYNYDYNHIKIEFISKEDFKKLEYLNFQKIEVYVEDENLVNSEKLNYPLSDLREGCFCGEWDTYKLSKWNSISDKDVWKLAVAKHIASKFKTKINEWKNARRMEILNKVDTFKILQGNKEINIIDYIKSGRKDPLTLRLCLKYQFKFKVKYESKNKDFQIRSDFEEGENDDEWYNPCKKLKESNAVGEECWFYDKLTINIKNKADFVDEIKKHFKEFTDWGRLEYKIGENDDDGVDIENVRPENLLGKENLTLRVICSEWTEYVESYVFNGVGFTVDKLPAGEEYSKYSICEELDKMKNYMMAFSKTEDINPENITQKLKIRNENKPLFTKVLMYQGYDSNEQIDFDIKNFHNGTKLYLEINAEAALGKNIIRQKTPGIESKNNYQATTKISDMEFYDKKPTDFSEEHTPTKIPNIGGPDICCSCCTKCCKSCK